VIVHYVCVAELLPTWLLPSVFRAGNRF